MTAEKMTAEKREQILSNRFREYPVHWYHGEPTTAWFYDCIVCGEPVQQGTDECAVGAWYGFGLAWHTTRCGGALMTALVDRSKSRPGRARKTKSEILQALSEAG